MKRLTKPRIAQKTPNIRLCGNRLKKSLRHNYDLYLMSLPVVIYYIIFAYLPRVGT